MISVPVVESRLPVGSSASRTWGSFARARAIATRCCSPPDSLLGTWSARSARPTDARSSRTRARRSLWDADVGANATSTFWAAVSVGMRLNCWNTKPSAPSRSAESSRSPRRAMSRPSNSSSPSLGRSSAPRSWRRVVFPEPLGRRSQPTRRPRSRDPPRGRRSRARRRGCMSATRLEARTRARLRVWSSLRQPPWLSRCGEGRRQGGDVMPGGCPRLRRQGRRAPRARPPRGSWTRSRERPTQHPLRAS